MASMNYFLNNKLKDLKYICKLLFQIHSISCGLKALSTKLAVEDASTCRTSCGGHGYLQVAGLAEILGSLYSLYTAEGEYTVVCLQAAR